MQELVYVKNDEAVCSSLEVAERFNKKHKSVLRAIENLLGGMPKNVPTPTMFRKSTHVNEQNGQHYPIYYMNRDGFSLLVMGFTGKRALEWKLQYIKAFNTMEAFIREKQTTEWIETRKQGQFARRTETEGIKELVGYARAQGSEHPEKLYVNYTKLANKAAGISNRELATITQLNKLELIENMILALIREGMAQQKHYKEIYAACRARVELFSSLTATDKQLH